MSRFIFYWWVIIGSGLIVTLVLFIIPLAMSPTKSAHTDAVYRQLRVGSTELKVAIADTPAKQVLGLGGRATLPAGSGMLFVYQQPSQGNFWMKDMKFALDFVWIADGRVVQIDQNIPAPSTLQEEPARIYPQQPYDRVLEVPAGWVDEHNLQLGETVELL